MLKQVARNRWTAFGWLAASVALTACAGTTPPVASGYDLGPLPDPRAPRVLGYRMSGPAKGARLVFGEGMAETQRVFAGVPFRVQLAFHRDRLVHVQFRTAGTVDPASFERVVRAISSELGSAEVVWCPRVGRSRQKPTNTAVWNRWKRRLYEAHIGLMSGPDGALRIVGDALWRPLGSRRLMPTFLGFGPDGVSPARSCAGQRASTLRRDSLSMRESMRQHGPRRAGGARDAAATQLERVASCRRSPKNAPKSEIMPPSSPPIT